MIAPVPLDPAAAVFAAFAAALWLKGVALSAVQVQARVRARAFARPEDAAMLRLTPSPEPAAAARAGDAWRNETENAPFALGLAAAAVLVSVPWPPLAVACGAFVLARLNDFQHAPVPDPAPSLDLRAEVIDRRL